MKPSSLAMAVTLAVGTACNAIESAPGAPVNSCPLNPCSAYVQTGSQPTCTSGACLVTAPATGLVLMVEMPVTSGFAPGGTFVTLLDPFLAESQGHPIPGCLPPNNDNPLLVTCAALPPFVSVQGAYLIAPSATAQVSFPLGNRSYTTVPSQATFRLLWPPTGGSSGGLAEALGLPIEPIQSLAILASTTLPLPPGPAQGPSVGFRAFLQPGSYEVALRPSPPFDSVFGPEIADVTVDSDPPASTLPSSCDETSGEPLCVDGFDVTQETGQGRTLPTFDITRTNGLTGWSAYLRDSSGTTVSNVAALTGSTAHVVFATHHVAPGADALSATALIIAPPFGTPYPTAVFAPIGNVLPAVETYPTLPAPSVINGKVVAEDGTPVAADLFFEALAITDANGNANTSNFEFVGEAQARPGGSFGLSAYSIELPQGSYRLSVRPLDPSTQVTTFPFTVSGAPSDSAQGTVVLAPLRTVAGAAMIADGRPLSVAEIDAQPVGCTSGTSTWCMPRDVTGTTAVDGTFALTLDPGEYLLRARPADGTRLPWTSITLVVQASDAPTTVPTIVVPAPVAAGLQLVDPTGNPIGQAQVRFFSMSSGSAAVEVGRTVTDLNGTFEMYLHPATQ
jgi:hypothetical protein